MAIKVSGTTVIDGSRNIINVGNIDGRDVSVDGAKLDGIEATADVTDAGNVNPLVDAHLNTSSATSGEYLSWTGSDYDWVAVSGYTDADVDTHLNTGTASSGEVLSWNGSDYDWVSGGAASLGDLNDVTISSGDVRLRPSNGDDSFYALWLAGQGASGANNIAIGQRAYRNEGGATGTNNVALGESALYGSSSSMTASHNVGIGYQAGYDLSTGTNNFLSGYQTGSNITTGSGNVAIGQYALDAATTLSNNIAIGTFAGSSITAAFGVTAVGGYAFGGGTGNYNTVFGFNAANSIGSATRNVYVGNSVGQSDFGPSVTGNDNVGIGSFAFGGNLNDYNATSHSSVVIGSAAGTKMRYADYTVAIGKDALGQTSTYVDGDSNVAIGYYSGFSTTTGFDNTFVGESSGSTVTTGSNLTVLGHNAQASSATVSNEITLGDSSITRFRVPGIQSAASDGDVLTYNATNGIMELQTPAAGGNSTSLTADGSITAGDPVIINTDGTVSSVQNVGFTTAVGASVQYSSAAEAEGTVIIHDELSGKMVVFCVDDVTDAAVAVSADINDLSATYGTSVNFDSNTINRDMSAVYDPVSQKFVVFYTLKSNVYGYAAVGSVSGSSISFETPVAFNSARSDPPSCCYDPISQQIILSYRAVIVTATISGSTLSVGTPTAVSGMDDGDRRELVYDSSNQQVVIFYNNTSGTAQVAPVSIGSGTASVGSPTSLGVSVGTKNWRAVYDSSASRFLVTHNGSSIGQAIVVSYDGSSFSVQSPVTFTNNSANTMSTVYADHSGKSIITYQDTSDFYGKFILAEITGDIVSFSDLTTFETNFTAYPAVGYDPVEDRVLLAWDDQSVSTSSPGSYAAVVRPAATSTNLLDSNFIGFSSASYSDGEGATITLNGSVDENQTGLQPSSKYYVQIDGTLSTTPGTPSVYAGQAISTSKIIVKG